MEFNYAGHGFDLAWTRLPDAIKSVAIGVSRGGRIVTFCRFDLPSSFELETTGLFIGQVRSADPFVLTLDGAAEAFAGGSEIVSVVGPGHAVSGRFEGPHAGEFVSIPPDAIARALGSDEPYDIGSMIHDATDEAAVCHLMRTIRTCLALETDVDPFAYEAILDALVRLLAVRDVDARRAPHLSVDQACAVRALIVEGLATPLTIGGLAQALDLSEGYFGRAFKETFGTSPYQYVLRERVALASKLLSGGATGFDEVARDAGFTSAAAMTRAMKAHAGSTARAMRAALRRVHVESPSPIHILSHPADV